MQAPLKKNPINIWIYAFITCFGQHLFGEGQIFFEKETFFSKQAFYPTFAGCFLALRLLNF
jgi:hypothetical protein